MQSFPATYILRHRRENLKKCSLRGLEGRIDMVFGRYPTAVLPPLNHYVLLALNAPELTEKEAGRGLLLLDATWRYAAKMQQFAIQELAKSATPFIMRSLPSCWRTAYPRQQEDCPDPELGLASIEALYVAYRILGRPTEGLLDGYHWKELFFERNKILEK